jgi:hypothetical protein
MRKSDLNTMLHEAITEIFKSLVPSFEFGFYRDRAAKVAQGQCDVDYICNCLKEVLSAKVADIRGQEAIAAFGGLIAKLPELAESSKLTLCVRSKDPIPGYFAHIRYEYFSAIAETKTSIDKVRTTNNLDGNNILALVELGVNTIENTVSARKSHKQAMQDFKQLYNEVTQQLGLVTR